MRLRRKTGRRKPFPNRGRSWGDEAGFRPWNKDPGHISSRGTETQGGCPAVARRRRAVARLWHGDARRLPGVARRRRVIASCDRIRSVSSSRDYGDTRPAYERPAHACACRGVHPPAGMAHKHLLQSAVRILRDGYKTAPVMRRLCVHENNADAGEHHTSQHKAGRKRMLSPGFSAQCGAAAAGPVRAGRPPCAVIIRGPLQSVRPSARCTRRGEHNGYAGTRGTCGSQACPIPCRSR